MSLGVFGNIKFMALWKYPKDWYVYTEEIDLSEGRFEPKDPSPRISSRIYSNRADAIKGGKKEAKRLGLQFFDLDEKVISVASIDEGTFAVLKYKVGTSSIKLKGSMSYLDAFTEAMKTAARKTNRALVLP